RRMAARPRRCVRWRHPAGPRACALSRRRGRGDTGPKTSTARPQEDPMTATTTEAPKLSDAQIAEALALMKDSDSVELKLTVGEDQQRSTAMALGMDPLEAQIRMVAFFDTPELTLDRAGVVVRARR